MKNNTICHGPVLTLSTFGVQNHQDTDVKVESFGKPSKHVEQLLI